MNILEKVELAILRAQQNEGIHGESLARHIINIVAKDIIEHHAEIKKFISSETAQNQGSNEFKLYDYSDKGGGYSPYVIKSSDEKIFVKNFAVKEEAEAYFKSLKDNLDLYITLRNLAKYMEK